MKRKTKILAVMLALLLAAAAVWYFLPVRRSACLTRRNTETGETAQAELELVLRRKLFAPMRLSGTVRMEGERYTSWIPVKQYGGRVAADVFVRDGAFGTGKGNVFANGSTLTIMNVQLGRNMQVQGLTLLRHRDGSMWQCA